MSLGKKVSLTIWKKSIKKYVQKQSNILSISFSCWNFCIRIMYLQLTHNYAVQIEVCITQNLLPNFDELHFIPCDFLFPWIATMILFGEIYFIMIREVKVTWPTKNIIAIKHCCVVLKFLYLCTQKLCFQMSRVPQ